MCSNLGLNNKSKIRFEVSYRDFVFYNEFRCLFFDLNSFFLQFSYYLSCHKKKVWIENFLLIGIRYKEILIDIERTFISKEESMYRYLETDESKKVILDIDNISKEEILKKVEAFFEKCDEKESD